jgi:hypothetical protein
MGGDCGGWLPENGRARVFPENPGPTQALVWQGIAPTWLYGSSGMAGYEWLLKFNTPSDDKCIFPKTDCSNKWHFKPSHRFNRPFNPWFFGISACPEIFPAPRNFFRTQEGVRKRPIMLK